MSERSLGRRIGRYVVRRRLGAGGFARVYLGFDPDLEFEVAIKVLKAQFADDADAVERFRREATTAVRLRHPNVVTVLTVGRLEEEFEGAPLGGPYLVMDYLPDSLAERLAGSPVLAEEEVRRIGAEVARGLDYAHRQGVVHRDIKPDNILFGRDGQAVVTDFGIARAVADTLSPITRSSVVGTPSYFSPEQARGLPLDGRTDVYALGVTLYQAATGALPFTGDDWYAVMRQHVEDPPPPPSTRNPAISPQLDAIILRTLAKDPNDRFATAADLADALVGAGRSTAAVAPLETRDTHSTVVVAPYEAQRASTVRAWRASRSGRRWLIAGIVAGGIVAGGVLTMVISQAVVENGVQAPPPARPADSIAAVPAPPRTDSLPGVVPGAPPATPGFDSAALTIPTASLAITAPAAASIRINGVAAGRGSVKRDTLRPGTYTVRATVPATGRCPSADTTATVTLAARDAQELRLRPRACGAISITTTPGPARFTLRPVGGGADVTGSFPVSQPLPLPEGDYRLILGGVPNCGEFNDVIRIAAGSTYNRHIRLLCGA